MSAHKFELLIIFGTIILAIAFVVTALNPAARRREARNTARTAAVDTILSAIHQYVLSTGSVPPEINSIASQIGTCTTGGNVLCPNASSVCIDLSTILSSGEYLKSNPLDPLSGTASSTGYAISRDVNNVFTVSACQAEGLSINHSR
ncbi:MAG: hypothetical protein WAV41_00415 [Microgenomates group bacterium]